jgi:predicted MPP superfamily phosphohydrolase
LPLLRTTRRRFIGLAAGAGVAAVAADSILIEPNHPRIVRMQIVLPRWPARLDGFTIALLADFHYDAHFSRHPLQAAIGMVNSLRPDLIALVGDFVSVPLVGDDEQAAADAEPCARLLRQMQAPHGLWAVLGNHDCATDPRRVAHALRAQGIQVLANQSVPVERDGGRFWLAGVDDVLFGDPNLDTTLRDLVSGEATILLAHEPDYADYVSNYTVDLQLSGHSHGGQVRFPFLPPLFLPDLGRKYVRGFYKVGPLSLYTNAGLGTVNLPIRWNCPPEITLLTLRKTTAQ